MSKRYLLYAVLVLLLGLGGWMSAKIMTMVKAKQRIEANLRQLPSFTAYKLDSTQLTITDLLPGQPTAIVFFNSQCDHCQYEAQELRKKYDAFAGVNLLLLSSENLDQIRAFSKRYSLDRLQIAKLPAEQMFATFGNISVPSIFIFNRDRYLVKKFNGETKAEALLKYLK
jgi:peroxiredoxin